jgi:hypothetical protein
MIIRRENYPDAYEAWAHYLDKYYDGLAPFAGPYPKDYLSAGRPITVPTMWPIDWDPAAYPPDDVDSSRGRVKR